MAACVASKGIRNDLDRSGKPGKRGGLGKKEKHPDEQTSVLGAQQKTNEQKTKNRQQVHRWRNDLARDMLENTFPCFPFINVTKKKLANF